jgi:fructose-1,6-bisphosphatase I
MTEIFDAIKRSAIRIKEAIVSTDTGATSATNATGDTQLKLDVLSDRIIEEEFASIQSVQAIISEEKEAQTPLHVDGTYIVGYDPLDGSSLVDVNLSVGSIFGIYKDGIAGKNLQAAAYVVYGPRVELVIAHKEVSLYRLTTAGEFTFVRTLALNPKGKLNAPGGTQKGWPAFHKQLIDSLFQEGYRLRYSGGMVPDLHQILLKGGGLFSYPGTSDVPKGKLRMVFEVFPFAFIYEKAGGAAIDGTTSILSLTPNHAHDTSPCFFGSKTEIEAVKEAYARA